MGNVVSCIYLFFQAVSLLQDGWRPRLLYEKCDGKREHSYSLNYTYFYIFRNATTEFTKKQFNFCIALTRGLRKKASSRLCLTINVVGISLNIDLGPLSLNYFHVTENSIHRFFCFKVIS